MAHGSRDPAGRVCVLAPFQFQLTHLSALPDQNDTHTFSAESARGGKLRSRGTAKVESVSARSVPLQLALET